jgi:hypothetical protein
MRMRHTVICGLSGLQYFATLSHKRHDFRKKLLRIKCVFFSAGRDSSVGTATRYGLEGPGIESLWGEIFSAPVQTGPGAHPTSNTMGSGSFPGVKRPGRGADHSPQSSAEVKERVDLYL